MLAAAALVVAVVPASPANATYPGANGRIALVRHFAGLSTVNVDGSDPVLLGGNEHREPAWSPDGTRIAFGLVGLDEDNQLWTMAADGSDRRLVTALGEHIHDPTWSPDGTKIAVKAGAEPCADGTLNGEAVYVIDVGTGQAEQISETLQFFGSTVCRLFNEGMSWSPDGTTIVASTLDTHESNNTGEFQGDLVAIDVATHTETNLTWAPGGGFYLHSFPSWSPAGDRIVSHYDGGPTSAEALRVMAPDGSAAEVLYDGPNYEASPRWSPDGTAIAFLDVDATGATTLMRVDADGTNPQVMFDVADDATRIDWQSLPLTDITITACDDPRLQILTTVVGNLILDLPDGCTAAALPVLTSVGGDLDVSGSGSLAALDLPALGTVGGDLDVSCLGNLSSIDLPALDTVEGDLDVRETGLLSMPVLDLDAVGSLSMTGNDDLSSVTMPDLDVSGGQISLGGNPALTDIDVSTLTSVAGDLDVSGNGVLASFDAGALETVGGDLDVSGNGVLATVDVPALGTVGGDLDISENGNVSSLDCTTGTSEPEAVSGSVAAVSLPLLTDVGGNATIATQQGDLDVSGMAVDDALALTGEGTSNLAALTAGTSTSLILNGTTASMEARLADGTFNDHVGFEVSVVPPASLVEEIGADASGSLADVTPLAAYTFTFAVPTLGQPAALAFELELAAMTPTLREAVEAAIGSGQLTVAVKGDAVGSLYEALAVCAVAETPAIDGCVTLQLLDADRQPVSAVADGASVRFEGVAGHFSTWAVALVEPVALLDVSVTPGAGGAEGTAIAVEGLVTGGGDATTLAWTAAPSGVVDAGATCVFGDVTAAATTMICDDDGTWTLRLTATDGASDFAESTVVVTNADPSITVTAPADASEHLAGEPVVVASSLADAGANDTLTCEIDWGDGTTTTPAEAAGDCSGSHAYAATGPYTIAVNVEDHDGGSVMETRDVVVTAPAYAFEGFFAPVDATRLNVMKSGATAPIKFRLRDAAGVLVTDPAVLTTSGVRTTCAGDVGLDSLEQYATGRTELRYDAAAEQFVFNWKSPSGKAGACYEVVIALPDGSEHTAQFRLR